VKEYTTDQIRNIALIGHGGVGKTCIAEAMAFSMGVTTRMGSVEAGNTISDFNPDEIERHISISASLLHGGWGDNKINILDVPGYSDFVGESKAGLRVAESVIMVMQASSGVDVGLEQGWVLADERELPRIFVINKLDKDQADFGRSLTAAQERFGRRVAAAQFPVDEGKPGFNTIVDVTLMKELSFATDGTGKMTVKDISKENQGRAKELREKLMETVAESDDELLESYLENGELTDEQFTKGFKIGINHRKLFPVFCTSATVNIGIHRLLDVACKYLPSPVEALEVVGKRPNKDEEVKRHFDKKESCSLFIFKVLSEPRIGDLSFFKVISGTVSTGTDLVNTSTGSGERIGTMSFLNGKTREDVSQVVAGDIGAAVKLKSSHASDTLAEKGDPVVYPRLNLPKPSISVALIPKSRADEEKIGEGLNRLHEEDPSFTIMHDAEMSQIILAGQGEVHLNLIVKRLKDKFGVEVETREPKIPYRETVRGKATVKYRHKKQSGGAGQFGEVSIMLQPYREEAPLPVPSEFTVRGEELDELPWGGKFRFINCIVGGSIDARFIPAVKKGIMETMQLGAIAGYPIRDVQVILFDGMMHPVDSNENAFRTAGRMAFRNAVIEAKPVIHEPIYDVVVRVPEEYMGEVMGDLSSRRGKILGMESDGQVQTVRAKVPASELYRYSTKLRSMTAGRAQHERELSHYEEVPKDVADKIIEEAKKEKEEKE
jgi:elongation factor G